ncbi:molecular chaperone [Porphyrobacter sp. AAP60]|nr:molecular chaperone [Porphyrobacter sp. AAP60]
MRRFYNDVALAAQPEGYQVMLDSRGLKTVGGAPQIVPTQALGEALAAEWRKQGEKIDPASLPLRDMADYAIDIVAPDPAAVAQGLVAYAETDTLCYRADPDEPFYARQIEVWEPLLSAFEAAHGIALVRVSGVLHRPQPPKVLAILRDRLLALDPFALAGAEVMTKLAASLVTALAALDARGEEEPLALWQAACLEEEWQADLWGRDWEAEERRAKREADFLRACAFVRLARG